MTERAAPPRASETEQAPAHQNALPPAALGASPRPWVMRMVRQPLTDDVYFIRIEDANGNKVATLSPHHSVGGRGLEQATADARLIVTLANSGAAQSIEREASGRTAAPADIPEADRQPAKPMKRLL